MSDNRPSMWNPPRKLSAFEAYTLTARQHEQRGLRAYLRRALEMSQLTREPLLKTALMLPFFAWTTPTTRSTGDLITAAIYNTDIVDNLIYLHQRQVTKWFPFGNYNDTAGDFNMHQIASAGTASGTFMVPDDFDSLVSLELLASHSSTGTWTFTLTSDYFNPSLGEALTANTGSSVGQTQGVVSNIPEFINIAGVYASLDAGDWGGLTFTNTSNSGGNAACRIFGFKLVYLRV